MVRTRLASGAWRRMDNAVYALPSHSSTWHQRVMAATLGNPGAVASGKTAAALFGIEGFRKGAVEITVPHRHPTTSGLALVRHSDHVRPTRRDGIPVNSPVLTWYDLLGSITPDAAEIALEDFMRKGLIRFDQLASHFVAWEPRRRPGVALARTLLEARDEDYIPSASELERQLYATFDIDEFHPFIRQACFPWRATSNERLDGLVVVGGVITEGDGRCWHEQRRDMANDRRRDREATANGYRPMRWMWTDLRDAPEDARSAVRRAQLAAATGAVA